MATSVDFLPLGETQVLAVVHQRHWRLPHGALDLLVSAVPHHDDLATLSAILAGLVVHLGHERTCRIDDVEVPFSCSLEVFWPRAMRREYYVCPFRNVPDVFDSYGPSRLQGLAHVRVVHDLVFQVHRGTESLERDLHHVDRPIDARAEATWGC